MYGATYPYRAKSNHSRTLPTVLAVIARPSEFVKYCEGSEDPMRKSGLYSGLAILSDLLPDHVPLVKLEIQDLFLCPTNHVWSSFLAALLV